MRYLVDSKMAGGFKGKPNRNEKLVFVFCLWMWQW